MENGVMMQYFEWYLPNDGNLWNKLKADAAHLRDIGVTAVWIPPAYKADEQEDEGYATYDLYDLGEFDQKGTVRTKYGTREELQAMIDELHAHQISVYLDAVLNHKTGGDHAERFMVVEVAGDDRLNELGEAFEIEGNTDFTFDGRNGKYSDFKWHWHHFSGVDYDNLQKRGGVFRIEGEGKAWSEGVDAENNNYDFLMCNDIDLDHPDVVEELKHWGTWVADALNLDGMRMDAIKHMRDSFMVEFLDAVRSQRGEQFYAVGEYWNADPDTLDTYVEATGGRINLFDVPLHYNMYLASQQGKDYDLQTLLTGTLTERHPLLSVTFVDNHDSQPGCSLESWVEDWFKPLAYGLILLMQEGYPCVFYGDYYGSKGEESPHRLIIDRLLDLRRRYAYGEQVDYFDHPSTVGFVRTGDGEHSGSGLVFLMNNDEAGSKSICLGEAHQGEEWQEATGSIADTITLDENGCGEFSVQGRNLAVWIQKEKE